MKNIHVIQTDKTSRLFIGRYRKELFLCDKPTSNIFIAGQNQHIYITSDEEIKEGDWCYYLNNLGGGNSLCQAYKHSEDKRMLFDNGTHNREIGEGITPLIGECKKIILTTDQELIKNGVQAIDDEFLEWFVKNPSCESVEVVKDRVFRLDEFNQREFYNQYKITIPKEENIYDEYLKDELKKYKDVKTIVFNKPKQEILLEESLEEVKDLSYYKTNAEEDYLRVPISVLRYISQLEQEVERSYSEEDLEKAFKVGFTLGYGSDVEAIDEKDKCFNRWFKIFKNK